ELGGAAGEGAHLLGVGLVVGVDLDGQLARGGARPGGDDPQVGAALVDDPLAVAADAGPAHAVLGGVGQLLGFKPRGWNPWACRGIDRDAHDVGRGAEKLADVVKSSAVGAPHGRGVLALEGGQPAVVGAVGVADPDVVVGGAAVALAVPRARPADVG